MVCRKLLIIFMLGVLGGCGGETGTQKEVDQATQWFALTIRTFIGFFEDNLKNCGDFLSIYDALTEDVVACDNGDQGDFQVTKGMVQCADGPPLNASVNFTITTQNCEDSQNDVTATGIQDLVVSFSAEGNIGVLMTEDLIVNGVGYIYDNFQTKVDLSDNSLSCSDSDDLTVLVEDTPEQTCGVSSNCRGCSL